MGKYHSFLKWLLLTAIVNVGVIIAYKLGVFHALILKDGSYLGIATIVFYYLVSSLAGYSTFAACEMAGSDDYEKQEGLKKHRRIEEVLWFSSEKCLVLGMAGTIIGFIMMLSGFDTLDISNMSTIQSLLSELGKAMATALYTTLAGLFCGSLLKVQALNLQMELNSIEQDMEEAPK
jgi:hypothetical protein